MSASKAHRCNLPKMLNASERRLQSQGAEYTEPSAKRSIYLAVDSGIPTQIVWRYLSEQTAAQCQRRRPAASTAATAQA